MCMCGIYFHEQHITFSFFNYLLVVAFYDYYRFFNFYFFLLCCSLCKYLILKLLKRFVLSHEKPKHIAHTSKVCARQVHGKFVDMKRCMARTFFHFAPFFWCTRIRWKSSSIYFCL